MVQVMWIDHNEIGVASTPAYKTRSETKELSPAVTIGPPCSPPAPPIVMSCETNVETPPASPVKILSCSTTTEATFQVVSLQTGVSSIEEVELKETSSSSHSLIAGESAKPKLRTPKEPIKKSIMLSKKHAGNPKASRKKVVFGNEKPWRTRHMETKVEDISNNKEYFDAGPLPKVLIPTDKAILRIKREPASGPRIIRTPGGVFEPQPTTFLVKREKKKPEIKSKIRMSMIEADDMQEALQRVISEPLAIHHPRAYINQLIGIRNKAKKAIPLPEEEPKPKLTNPIPTVLANVRSTKAEMLQDFVRGYGGIEYTPTDYLFKFDRSL